MKETEEELHATASTQNHHPAPKKAPDRPGPKMHHSSDHSIDKGCNCRTNRQLPPLYGSPVSETDTQTDTKREREREKFYVYFIAYPWRYILHFMYIIWHTLGGFSFMCQPNTCGFRPFAILSPH